VTDPRPPGRLAALRLSPTVILRFLVSLALALLLWGWVTTQRDPVIPQRFPDLEIQVPELEDELEVSASELPPATVWLEGPRSIVEAIDGRDLEPRLDLGGIEVPGDYTVNVVLAAPPGTRVDRIQPRTIPINVDRRDTRSFMLEPVVEQPADGTRRVGTPRLGISEVVVTGPQGRLDQIAQIALPIEIGARTDDFTARFVPIARDANGNDVPGVTIQPAEVEAMVPVEARGRSVPVLATTVGNPAEGYEQAGIATNPPTVILDGPDDVLSDIVSVSTRPMNIEGATEQVTQRVALDNLPPDVRVVEPASGEVYAIVQIRQRGSTQALQDLPVTVTNLGPGLVADVEPATVDVTVFAPDATLAELRAGDIEPSVSAAGLGVGSHEAELMVTVPPGLQWIRSEPAAVRLVIRPASGTPEAAPTRERQLP